MAMPHILELLATKGDARPALRPEAPPRNPSRFRNLRLRPNGREAASAPQPAAEDNVVNLPAPQSPKARPTRVGVTLRLDPEHHGKLRRFTLAQGRTMQSVLHEALERYMAERGGWDGPA